MGDSKDQPHISEKQQVILDVASTLMTEHGIENTSLADIARAADISKGTLYYYYASKADLIFDIATQHIKRITDELLSWLETQRDVPDPDLTQILAVVLQTMLQAEVRGRMHFYLLQDALTNNDDIRRRFTVKYQEWMQLLRGQIADIAPTIDAPTAAHIMIACIDGLMLQKLLGIEPIPVIDIAAFLTNQTD
jgi:AcrR family transcriptional regulator